MMDDPLDGAIRRALAERAPQELPSDLWASVEASLGQNRLLGARILHAIGVAAAVAVIGVALVLAAVLALNIHSQTVAVRPVASAAANKGSSSPLASVAPASPTLGGVGLRSALPATVDSIGLLDAQFGWAVSSGTVFTTTDGGRTWMLTAKLPSDWIQFEFSSPEEGWAVRQPLQPTDPTTVERTSDRGRAWSAATIDGSAGLSPSLDVVDGQTAYVLLTSAGTAPGRLLATTNGGRTWQTVSAVPAYIVGPAVFADSSVGWALATNAAYGPTGRPTTDGIAVTTDGGRTWHRSQLPVPPGLDATTPVTVTRPPVPSGHERAAVVVTYGNPSKGATVALFTQNAGQTWVVSGAWPFDPSLCLGQMGEHEWAVFPGPLVSAGGPLIERTSNDGATWSRVVASGLPAAASVRAAAFAGPSDGWIMLDTPNGQPGSLVGALYSTRDGGESWTPAFTP